MTSTWDSSAHRSADKASISRISPAYAYAYPRRMERKASTLPSTPPSTPPTTTKETTPVAQAASDKQPPPTSIIQEEDGTKQLELLHSRTKRVTNDLHTALAAKPKALSMIDKCSSTAASTSSLCDDELCTRKSCHPAENLSSTIPTTTAATNGVPFANHPVSTHSTHAPSGPPASDRAAQNADTTDEGSLRPPRADPMRDSLSMLRDDLAFMFPGKSELQTGAGKGRASGKASSPDKQKEAIAESFVRGFSTIGERKTQTHQQPQRHNQQQPQQQPLQQPSPRALTVVSSSDNTTDSQPNLQPRPQKRSSQLGCPLSPNQEVCGLEAAHQHISRSNGTVQASSLPPAEKTATPFTQPPGTTSHIPNDGSSSTQEMPSSYSNIASTQTPSSSNPLIIQSQRPSFVRSSNSTSLERSYGEIAVEESPPCDACEFCDDVCLYENCLRCKQKRQLVEAKQKARAARGSQKQPYTMCQIKRHSTKEDCWLVAKKRVFDVSDFIARHFHRGGTAIIFRHAGEDVTKHFKMHSARAQKELWATYEIGSLAKCPSEDAATTANENEASILKRFFHW